MGIPKKQHLNPSPYQSFYIYSFFGLSLLESNFRFQKFFRESYETFDTKFCSWSLTWIRLRDA